MQINNIKPKTEITAGQRDQNFKGARSLVRTLANPDALTSTIVLESFVTGGRGINAYKRGGFPEFRERFTDDVVSAVFWMKGVDLFNSLGNKFGKHVLKLPTTEFDVGKDALRTPFANLISDLGEKTTDPEMIKSLEKKLAAFKFTKIILSTLMATTFVGFILPKINQAITKKLMQNRKNNEQKKSGINIDSIFDTSIEEFDKKISQKSSPSFKGISPELMTKVAHALENNKICKMLTCDVGILTGRVKTARNADEGREYFFRDATSCFFYFASTPLVYKFLQKISGKTNLTNIDPVASKQINDNILNQLKNADGTFSSMNIKEFTSKVIGCIDDGAKALMEKLPFNSDVIPLSELSKHITDENLIQKAKEMAKLQPVKSGVGEVLTRQQVMDVLKQGSINTPEFMQSVYKSRFGEALTNPYKFIPMKKITSFRENIDRYLSAIVKSAEKNNGIIDESLIKKINTKSFIMSAVFRAAAIGVSAFALGFAIPKIQYAITAKKTGKNEAPGLREYKKDV